MYLNLDKITKQYRSSSEWAIQECSLSLAQGEKLYLIGESGSGKTTILCIIAGFERASSGSVSINGSVVESRDLSVAPQLRDVGFIFQDPSLFPHLDVEGNIGFGLSGISRVERSARIEEMVDLFSLRDCLRRYPNQLSGGQQQRVAVARAFAIKPSIMLFDEAFSKLNYQLRDRILSEVKQILYGESITSIFVSHSIVEAFNNADKIGVLQDGEIQQLGTVDEILKKPANVHVANAIGCSNVFKGVAVDGGIQTEIGYITRQHDLPRECPVHVCAHPRGSFMVKECGSVRTSGINGKVMNCSYREDSKLLVVKIVDTETEVFMNVDTDFPVSVGDDLSFDVAGDKMHVFAEAR